MASSSMAKNCFYCFSRSDVLRAGWPLRSGGFAMLCNRCASAYEEGSFCNIFHLDSSGWRYCDTCKKCVHCGCIMSVHTYSELDDGGVRCTECMANDVSMGPRFRNVPPQNLEHLRDPSEIILYVDLSHMINGKAQGIPSQEGASSSIPTTELPNAADTHFENPGGNADSQQGDAHTMTTHSHAQYCASLMTRSYGRYTLEPSQEELRLIRRDANSIVIPLFEKTLTGSDVDHKNGRVVVPKKCAQDCLPKLFRPEGIPIKIQDTIGNHWEFNYRFWPNSKSQMYVLEGMKEYLLLHQCKAGDKVAFYRIEPEGRFVMGLKKANATPETTRTIGNASKSEHK